MHAYEHGRSLIRVFRHAPIYAFAIMASLALATATTCASYAAIRRAFLDPLPYADADRLVSLHTVSEGRQLSVSAFVCQALAESPAFTHVTPFRAADVTYQTEDTADRLLASEVTPDYFATLGVAPAIGAAWSGEQPDAAVVSWRFFTRSLGGDPASIGRRISIDGVARTVHGVMPRDFVPPFGSDTDVWLPLNLRALLADTAPARRTVRAIARLAPGTTPAAADAYMKTFSDDERMRTLKIDPRDAWTVNGLREDLVGNSRLALVATAAAAVLLQLIVWANVAGLSVAHAMAQRRALAVRTALGASAAHLLRERIVESLALSTLGSVAGVWLSYALIAVAARYQEQFLAGFAPLAFDASIAAAGGLLGIVGGTASAVAPQQAVRRLQASDLLGGGQRATSDLRVGKVRSALVLVQVAVAIVLMISAGLLVRTVRHLSSVELGFDTQQLTTFAVNLPLPRYRPSERQMAFERDVLERIRQIRGVDGASASVGFPAARTLFARLTILDRPNGELPSEITYLSVAPRFFSFLGIPIKAGREIVETDDFPAGRVAVINETMARLYWPDGRAIGARVKIGAGAPTDREITIVGVVADVRQHGPTQDVRPTAYGSTLQYSWPQRHFSVKTAAITASVATDLRKAIHAVDPQIGMEAIRAFDDQLSRQIAMHRLVRFILGVFTVVAVVLSGFGIYAVVALTAQSRRREFAIRVALGARPAAVQGIVMRQAMLLAGGGAIAGSALAAFLTDALQGILHGVQPVDRLTFSAAIAAVLVLGTLAALLPAWKAGRVDPIQTLRAE